MVFVQCHFIISLFYNGFQENCIIGAGSTEHGKLFIGIAVVLSNKSDLNRELRS